MNENYTNPFFNSPIGGGGFWCYFVLLAFCIIGLNSSCSDNLSDPYETPTESASAEAEHEDLVLNYIKSISSHSYVLSHTDSIVSEKNISRDSAYFEYLHSKYVYLINNFFNNKKYDAIDLPLFLMEQDRAYDAPRTRMDFGDVNIQGIWGYGITCLQEIRKSVVRCYPDAGEEDMCNRIMMAFAYDQLKLTDPYTSRFIDWLYQATNSFNSDYVSNLVPEVQARDPDRSAISARLSTLSYMSERIHTVLCPNRGSGGSGGNPGGGNPGGGGSGSSGGGGGTTTPNPDGACNDIKCYYCRNCINPVKLDCLECECIDATIKLNISTIKIDIFDAYNLEIIKENFKRDASISDITIEVRRAPNGNWIVLDNSNYTVQKTAKASGIWAYRAKLNYNGKILTSNEVGLLVEYPTLKKIVLAVNSDLNNIWGTTKNFVNANNPNSGRREFGCWIYVNTLSGNSKIECGPILEGPIVYGAAGTNGSVSPGSPSNSGSGDPITGEKRAVAFFHTHTPLAHLSDCVRPVGFSPSDTTYSNNGKIPLMMYDYVGIGGLLSGGHGINDPSKVYYFKSEDSRFAPMLF